MLSYDDKLPQTRNQCTSLVGAGMGSRPIYHNFYGPSFRADLQSQVLGRVYSKISKTSSTKLKVVVEGYNSELFFCLLATTFFWQE